MVAAGYLVGGSLVRLVSCRISRRGCAFVAKNVTETSDAAAASPQAMVAVDSGVEADKETIAEFFNHPVHRWAGAGGLLAERGGWAWHAAGLAPPGSPPRLSG